MNISLRPALVYVLLVLAASSAHAKDAAADAETNAAFTAARAAARIGPTPVTLRDQATLNLPDGYVFIPLPEAGRVMKALGNTVDDEFLGLVFPSGNAEEHWFVVAEYQPSGHIKDDGAKEWSVDKLFDEIKQGTEAANERRREAGFPELDVVGWIERPQYDARTHHLVWWRSAKDRGAAANAPQAIYYNTYLLGREGYVSLMTFSEMLGAAGRMT